MENVFLYFSGTGNSRYVAQQFCKKMNQLSVLKAHPYDFFKAISIEERIDFVEVLAQSSVVGLIFPTYGACVPRIMREFIQQYRNSFSDKKLLLFCTQLMFSGDGAHIVLEELQGINYQVLYAEHFNMPNNICDTNLFSIKSDSQNQTTYSKMNKKLDKLCKNLSQGKSIKRGFSFFSYGLGLLQRPGFRKVEQKKLDCVHIKADICTHCNKCIKACPNQNLYSSFQNTEKNKAEETAKPIIVTNKNCTLCYRCANLCPVQAINVMFRSPVTNQHYLKAE